MDINASYDVILTPLLTVCGHAFCKTCFHSLEENQATKYSVRCPNCRKDLVLGKEVLPAAILDYFIKISPVFCSEYPACRCKWTGVYSSLAEHALKCPLQDLSKSLKFSTLSPDTAMVIKQYSGLFWKRLPTFDMHKPLEYLLTCSIKQLVAALVHLKIDRHLCIDKTELAEKLYMAFNPSKPSQFHVSVAPEACPVDALIFSRPPLSDLVLSDGHQVNETIKILDVEFQARITLTRLSMHDLKFAFLQTLLLLDRGVSALGTVVAGMVDKAELVKALYDSLVQLHLLQYYYTPPPLPGSVLDLSPPLTPSPHYTLRPSIHSAVSSGMASAFLFNDTQSPQHTWFHIRDQLPQSAFGNSVVSADLALSFDAASASVNLPRMSSFSMQPTLSPSPSDPLSLTAASSTINPISILMPTETPMREAESVHTQNISPRRNLRVESAAPHIADPVLVEMAPPSCLGSCCIIS